MRRNQIVNLLMCKRCLRKLPESDFHRRGHGRQSWCRTCKREANRAYPAPPRFVPCAICGVTHERKLMRSEGNYFCGQRCRGRASQLRMKYGLNPVEWRELWDRQSGLCAMPGCRAALGMFGAAGHHVDHDHDTGAVRGLLCHACNVGLGWYERMVAIGADLYLGGDDLSTLST